jgi:hypothetical protein
MLSIIGMAIAAGPIVGLTVTWLILRYRQPAKPLLPIRATFDPTDFLSSEQRSRVKELLDHQEECRREKTAIYLRGDRHGLPRRTSDGRFHRRSEGLRLDDALDRLDRHFGNAEDELSELFQEAYAAAYENALTLANWDWHRRYMRRIELELLAYASCVIAIAWVMPTEAPLPQTIYSSMFLASLATAIPLVWIASKGVWKNIPYRKSADAESENRTAEFLAAEEVIYFDAEDNADELDDESQDEDRTGFQSPYAVLGVEPTASRDEITAAYRKLVRQYHPDFLQERGDELKQLADRKMKEINWAKEEALRAL